MTKSALLKENIKLKKLLGLTVKEEIPTYAFSDITLKALQKIVDIESKFNFDKFNDWFNDKISITDDDALFLEKLLTKNIFYLASYPEEELKMKFLSPILNRIDFTDSEKKICDFYDRTLTYETPKFIFNGRTDFMVAKGYSYPEQPYFFIQEFKPSAIAKDPRPQLLAELIAAVEINQFTTIKGAFIISTVWNFVILEKIGTHKYQYFFSKNYDCTDLKKLQGIYKNLLTVKQEISNLIT